MTAAESRLRAFGGGPLAGDRWVRVLYLDESGIGKIEKDRFLVVAGVVIHADTQWGALANALDKLLREAVPLGAKTPKFLHATDIYHGSGEFPRDVWDKRRRHDLLAAVGDLIHQHSLPVVWLGLDRRKFHTEVPTDDVASHLQEAYTVAAVACFMQTEMYMRQDHIGPEVCSIVMEQNQQLQKRIPEMIHFMRDPINNRSPDDTAELLPGWEAVMPLTKLIDTPACQPKTASSILQLADYCAFAMKRLLQGQKDGPQLVRPFGAHLLSYNLPGGPDMKGLFWNPVHMPSKWPFPIELKDGQFRPKTGALTK